MIDRKTGEERTQGPVRIQDMAWRGRVLRPPQEGASSPQVGDISLLALRQVVPAGQICREAQDNCDLPEYCDGQQGECPENVFQENGTPCQDGYCYNGACPTHQQQCQALWGKGEVL